MLEAIAVASLEVGFATEGMRDSDMRRHEEAHRNDELGSRFNPYTTRST
jgi:hypothetical protein